MNLTLILISLILLFSAVSMYIVIKEQKQDRGAPIWERYAIIGIITLCLQVVLLVYRFRYREFTISFEGLLLFVLFVNMIVEVIPLLLPKKILGKWQQSNKRIWEFLTNSSWVILTKNPHIEYFWEKLIQSLERLCVPILVQTKTSMLTFLVTPWVIAVSTLIYEIACCESFYYTIYALAFYVLMIKILEFLNFICRVGIHNNVSYNTLKFRDCNGHPDYQDLIGYSQDIVILAHIIYEPKRDITSREEFLLVWQGIYNIVFWGVVYIWISQINVYFAKQTKSFLNRMNILLYGCLLGGIFLSKGGVFFLTVDLLLLFLFLATVLLHEFSKKTKTSIDPEIVKLMEERSFYNRKRLIAKLRMHLKKDFPITTKELAVTLDKGRFDYMFSNRESIGSSLREFANKKMKTIKSVFSKFYT